MIKDSESEKYKIALDLKDKAISDLEVIFNNLKNDKEALDSQMKDLSQIYNLSQQELKQFQEELSNTINDFQNRLHDKEQVITSLNFRE